MKSHHIWGALYRHRNLDAFSNKKSTWTYFVPSYSPFKSTAHPILIIECLFKCYMVVDTDRELITWGSHRGTESQAPRMTLDDHDLLTVRWYYTSFFKNHYILSTGGLSFDLCDSIALANCDCLRRATCDWRPMWLHRHSTRKHKLSGPDCRCCYKRNTSLFLGLWPGLVWIDVLEKGLTWRNRFFRTCSCPEYLYKTSLGTSQGVLSYVHQPVNEWEIRRYSAERDILSHVNHQSLLLRRVVQLYGGEGIQQRETSVDSFSCCVLYAINLPGCHRRTRKFIVVRFTSKYQPAHDLCDRQIPPSHHPTRQSLVTCHLSPPFHTS